MRLSELVGLDVGDVDPISETARVMGKGARQRVCPVGGPALRLFQNTAKLPASIAVRFF